MDDDLYCEPKDFKGKSQIEFLKKKVKHNKTFTSDMRMVDVSKHSKRSTKADLQNSSVNLINHDKPPQKLFEYKTYIAPGSIGTQKTQIQWNRNSKQEVGTNKTQCLRFDQYMSRVDLDKQCFLYAHPGRFERINDLPIVNSKFRKVVDVDIMKI